MATQIKHRRGIQSEIDNFTPAIAEIVVNTSEDELVLGNGAKQGGVGVPKKDTTMLSFDTLDAAVQNKALKEGYAINLKERLVGKGGGGEWDVVLSSSVSPTGFNVVQCIGVPTLALVLRVGGTVHVKQFGVVGDGVADDTLAFGSLEASLPELTVVDMSGCSIRLTSDYEMQSNVTTFEFGEIYLDDCYLISHGTSNNDFNFVTFRGNEKLTRSDYLGTFLGEFDTPPAVQNGAGYFDRTLNRALIGKNNEWQQVYGPSGVIIKTESGIQSDRQAFNTCTFRYLDEGLRRESDVDSQDGLSLSGRNEFVECGAGLVLDDPKRVFINSNTWFVGCAVGCQIESSDYVGLGLNLQGAYFNGNIYGIRGSSIYDSIISGNVFDHNRYLQILGGDLTIGAGVEFTIPVGRVMRQLTFSGNNGRNNGDYSFKFIVEGQMDYCNITGNAAWLDNISNILIDYSSGGSVSNNALESNRFLNGYSVVDGGTPWTDGNANFDAFNGGFVRGYTTFGATVRLRPRDSLVFNGDEGNLTYLKDESSKLDGMWINGEDGEGGLSFRMVQTVRYWQTVNRPSSKIPVGYMYFDTTLGKPVWRALGSKWVDASGNTV